MDIDASISKYLTIAPKIFPEKGSVSSSKLGKLFIGIKGKPRFDAHKFEIAVKEMVIGILGDQGEDCLLENRLVEQDLKQCRT